jgi:hypothetical protein
MKSGDRAFMELLDQTMSQAMDAAVEDRLYRERTNPLTPDEYLEWITSMSGFIPKPTFVPMEGRAFQL